MRGRYGLPISGLYQSASYESISSMQYDIETLHPHLPLFSVVDMGGLQSCTAW